MNLTFHKYQATGNDFVLIANLEQNLHVTSDQIKRLCDRNFGIGADGLILLEKSQNTDFKMVYFNANGKQSTMCGNGARCIAKFAQSLGLVESNCVFEAIDGMHKARISNDQVTLKMNDVLEFKKLDNHSIQINTGSPHYVTFTDEIPQEDFLTKAKEIRHGKAYNKEGINVNFASVGQNINMRTFERGVENETLSCGTGVVATALAYQIIYKTEQKEIQIQTTGGTLKVTSEKSQDQFTNIWLTGEAKFVFKGEISV